jgi:hypothetical protein
MAVSSVHAGLTDMCTQLIESSVAAWPEDTLLPIALVDFKKLKPEDAFNLVIEHLGQYMDGLALKNSAVLFEAAKIPALAAIGIQAKFEAANASTRDTLWNYITHICKYVTMSKLYKNIPENILGAVNDAASGLKSKLDDGSIDLSSVNPYELGQQVMAKFNPKELEDMMRQITSNPETMSSIMAQMSSVLGPEALSNVASSMSESTGQIDLASLLKFMPKP